MGALQQHSAVEVRGFDTAVLGHAVTGARLDHVALGGEGFRGRLYHGHSAEVVFDMGSYRAPLFARGALPDDAPTLAFILRSDGAGRLNGRPVRAGTCFWFSEGRELAYATAALSDWVAVRMPRERLECLGLGLPGDAERIVDLPEAAVARLAAIARGVAQGSGSRADLEQLVQSLAAALGAVDGHAPPSLERRLAAVRRALEFIRAHCCEALTVGDLCLETGLSWRSLERAFMQVCGITPKAAIILCRLHRAREALQAADPGSETVTTVATRCGIGHLGRFPAAYRSVFGEYPSETLARVA
jgi:AraC-like DNA-binding protein